MKLKKKKANKASKTKNAQCNKKTDELSEFGSVKILKAGTSLAALLISQSSNGMTGPVY